MERERRGCGGGGEGWSGKRERSTDRWEQIRMDAQDELWSVL